ncbi:MAG: hypothetical protein ACXVCP_14130 [Bdellovibrio sp.]
MNYQFEFGPATNVLKLCILGIFLLISPIVNAFTFNGFTGKVHNFTTLPNNEIKISIEINCFTKAISDPENCGSLKKTVLVNKDGSFIVPSLNLKSNTSWPHSFFISAGAAGKITYPKILIDKCPCDKKSGNGEFLKCRTKALKTHLQNFTIVELPSQSIVPAYSDGTDAEEFFKNYSGYFNYLPKVIYQNKIYENFNPEYLVSWPLMSKPIFVEISGEIDPNSPFEIQYTEIKSGWSKAQPNVAHYTPVKGYSESALTPLMVVDEEKYFFNGNWLFRISDLKNDSHHYDLYDFEVALNCKNGSLNGVVTKQSEFGLVLSNIEGSCFKNNVQLKFNLDDEKVNVDLSNIISNRHRELRSISGEKIGSFIFANRK